MRINGLGLMTKMISMPIYGKKLLRTFFYNTILKLGMQNFGLQLFKVHVCIDDESWLTVIYLTARQVSLPM